MTKQELAKQDYIACMKQKDIAEKHDISVNTLKSWIKRYNWKKDKVAPLKKDATQIKKDAPLKEQVQEIDNPDLNDKQIMFCIEYLKCYNATKAYQRVYKCSYATAMREGHRLKNTPKISQEIERLKAMQRKNAFLDANSILQKYIDIAFASVTDYVSFGRKEIEVNDKVSTVNYVHLRDNNEVDGSLIESITEGREGVNVKLMSKHKALDFLEKHFYALDGEQKKKLDSLQLDIDIKEAKLVEMTSDNKPKENPLEGMTTEELREMIRGVHNVD